MSKKQLFGIQLPVKLADERRSIRKKKNYLCLIYNIVNLSKMVEKKNFLWKISWIRSYSQSFRKFSCQENLLLFSMVLDKASLDESIYARKTSLASIYPLKINNRNARKRCEICSKLTKTAMEQLSTVFIANFCHILQLFLVFILFTLDK